MNSYWVSFEGRESACVDAGSSDLAMSIAYKLTGVMPLDCKRLPYPSFKSRLNEVSDCPAFCLQPEKCCGSTSCRRKYSCDE